MSKKHENRSNRSNRSKVSKKGYMFII